MGCHIIITCGTSQLDNKKLTGPGSLGLKLQAIGFKDICSDLNQATETDNNIDWLQDQAVEPPLKKISEALNNTINNNGFNFIAQKDNPIGAELSTLIVLFHEAEQCQSTADAYIPDARITFLSNEQIEPKDNHFYLICSHANQGMFAAGIIKEVISLQRWGETDIIPVCGLCEQPTNTDLALQHFAEEILKVLSKTGAENGRSDKPVLFVISGGFKSTIPCMTVSSLAFCIPMIYLFENSKELQILATYPAMGKLKNWISAWEKISDLNPRSVPWFTALLDFRKSYPAKNWL